MITTVLIAIDISNLADIGWTQLGIGLALDAVGILINRLFPN